MSNVTVVSKKINWSYYEDNYDYLLKNIYPSRREKVNTFKNRKAALTSLASGIFFQELVEKEAGICGKKINMVFNQHGKPYIEGASDFCFNISHSGDMIFIGYGNAEIGVDVEEIRINKQDESIAERYFSLDEKEYIFSNTEEYKKERFFRIWTGKEAYLKYMGMGISIPLNSFSVLLDNNGLDLDTDKDSGLFYKNVGVIQNLKVKMECREEHGYMYSVCVDEDCEIIWKL